AGSPQAGAALDSGLRGHEGVAAPYGGRRADGAAGFELVLGAAGRRRAREERAGPLGAGPLERRPDARGERVGGPLLAVCAPRAGSRPAASAASTSSAVRSSWKPIRVSSSRMGCTRRGSYMGTSMLAMTPRIETDLRSIITTWGVGSGTMRRKAERRGAPTTLPRLRRGHPQRKLS